MTDYPTQLYQIGILLQEPYRGAKVHHNLKCIACDHIWSATPISKLQAHKKHDGNGCPNCNTTRKELAVANNLLDVIAQIEANGIVLLEPFTGSSVNDHTIRTLVMRVSCGHKWNGMLRNILRKDIKCPTCNIQVKRARCNANSKALQAKFRETATEWDVYKQTVYTLTRHAYTKHKKTINPLGLKRGLAGKEGVYHLDHIVSVRWCFDNGVPPEICADHTNLQMLGWMENIVARDHMKPGTIPAILEEWTNK